MMNTPVKLIIGLRNPGSAYENTRHNAGAWYVSYLAERQSVHFKPEMKFKAEIGLIEDLPIPCRLALPLTFMNHSGEPAQLLSKFYQIQPCEILIVHDDLDLPAGRIKLKTGGGHGGHNGLRDLIAKLGSNEFHRLRIGIGHPGHRDLVHNYVLSKPPVHERIEIMDAIERGATILPHLVCGDIAKAMNNINI